MLKKTEKACPHKSMCAKTNVQTPGHSKGKSPVVREGNYSFFCMHRAQWQHIIWRPILHELCPPPPRANMGLSKHGNPVCRHFSAFLEPSFLQFHYEENVVCSFVQAVGGVDLGVKVFVWLQFHVFLCSGVYAGLLGTLLYGGTILFLVPDCLSHTTND